MKCIQLNCDRLNNYNDKADDMHVGSTEFNATFDNVYQYLNKCSVLTTDPCSTQY